MKYNKSILYLGAIIGLMFISITLNAKDIDDKQYKFKITVPDHWKSNNAMDGTDKVYDFLSPDEMAFIQLRAFKASPGLSIDLLVEVYEENYLPKGSQRVDLVNKTSTNGIPGKNGTYLVSDNGFDVGISVFYVIQNGQGYTLSVIIPTTMTAYYEKDVKSIAQSFVIPGYERRSKVEESSSGLGGLSSNEGGLGGMNNATTNAISDEIEPFKGVEISNIRMGDELLSNTQVLNQMTTFLPQTENIYAVFDWKGEGASGQEMKIAWFFDQNNYKIDETIYKFPDFETEGTNNSVLSMPYKGWPVGDYYIEFSIAGQIVNEFRFAVSEDAEESTQDDFSSGSDAGDWNQAAENNLFEGLQVKGKMVAVISEKEMKKLRREEERHYSDYEDDHQKNSAKNSSFEKIMQEAANELNKTCPVMVDSETRLDNAEVVGGDTFKYNYTLLNSLRSEMDLEGTVEYLEPLLVDQVKSNSALQIYRENKITMAYYYYDRNGELAFNIAVSPDKYKN
ncbi:MAG: hypothetical protein PF484_05255 [Bacteroidales bacterium]|jgi:hypothetical protein|nr:hypothetical protein [Bacteroidales bacterium]